MIVSHWCSHFYYIMHIYPIQVITLSWLIQFFDGELINNPLPLLGYHWFVNNSLIESTWLMLYLPMLEPLSSDLWGSASHSYSPVTPPPLRPWSRLWNCQSRHGHQQHLRLETCSCHEISHSRGHGGYSGYLRHDRGRHHQSERYAHVNAVKNVPEYSQKSAFSHMASGLVCGFSCVVPLSMI
jgi:hypothetical protein